MISIGDIVRYEDTDDWDTMRDEDDREVGIVISIDDDDTMMIQWLNSKTAIHAEPFNVSDLAPYLTILSKG
jgi:hypothetical protein